MDKETPTWRVCHPSDRQLGRITMFTSSTENSEAHHWTDATPKKEYTMQLRMHVALEGVMVMLHNYIRLMA